MPGTVRETRNTQGNKARILPSDRSVWGRSQSTDHSSYYVMCKSAGGKFYSKGRNKALKGKELREVTSFVGWLDVDFKKLYREDGS